MDLSLHNIDIPITKEYSTGSNHEPIEFYLDGLATIGKIQ